MTDKEHESIDTPVPDPVAQPIVQPINEVLQEMASDECTVRVFQKFVYGLGMFCNNLVPAAIGCMSVVLNLGLKMNPVLVGYLLSFPRIFDAFIDPIMGHISDNTKSRFGRRRPYIVIGAISLGITFALMWRIGYGHSEMFYFGFFMLGFNILLIFNTIFATPYIALGYEMTPDYHERTKVMAWANWLGQIPWLLCPWFWWIMANKKFFDTPVSGAQAIALWVGITVAILGVLPGFFCREPYKKIADTVDPLKEIAHGIVASTKEFFRVFAVTLKCKPFLQICGATFFIFNGFMLISGLAMYIFIYFTFGGDQVMGGKYSGLFGTTSALSTIFIVIPFISYLSKKIGKKGAFIISTSISMVGYAAKWWCFNPVYSSRYVVNLPFMGDIQVLILLPAILISFGIGCVFMIMGSMMADTCDLDELNNGKRREGMFGAIYWWTVKLGSSVAFAFSGHILNHSGFNVALAAQSAETLLKLRLFDIGLPILTTIIAILAIVTYGINEDKSREIRLALEKRRGKTA